MAQAGRRGLWASKGLWAGWDRRAGAAGKVFQLGWSHPCCLHLRMAGEFKLGYSHCHSLNITFIF